MREEAVPVELAGFRIPGPVRFLGIREDDPRARVFLVGIAPDIPVAGTGIRVRTAGALEPVVLVGRVVDDEFGDDPQAALLGFLDEAAEILHRPEIGVDVAVIGDVIAVVAAGGGVERQQPQRGDAEILQIPQFLGQPGKVADAVIVAVGEGLDVELVDDRILVPELVGGGLVGWHLLCFDDKAAIRIQRIGTVDRKGDAGVGALGGLRFFVHGDATAMEMTSPFRLQKGRRSGHR